MNTSVTACSQVDGPLPSEPYPTNSSASTGRRSSNNNSDSDFATEPEDFESWARQVNLDPPIHEITTPEVAIFKPLQDIQVRSSTLPRYASDEESDQFKYVTPRGKKYKDLLCSKLQSGEFPLHDNPHELDPETFMLLFDVCAVHERVRLQTVGCGADRRLRVAGDRIMFYACDYDTEDERMMCTIDQEVRLPATTPGGLNGTTTTANGLGWVEISDFEPCIASPDFLREISVVCFPLDKPHLVLVLCVASYTAIGTAENEVKRAIVSALQQKKVLRMPDQFVFGVFQFDTDYLEVVAGIWRGDEIKIYKVGTYYLLDPVSVCQLYIVYRGIKRLGKIYEDEIVAAGSSLAKVARANSPSNKWIQYPQAGDQGLSRELPALEKWKMEDRINAFRQSTRDCETILLSPEAHDSENDRA